MDATEKGLAVIRSFEGRALKAYRDSVGVWTIGFGSTNYDKFAVAYLGRPIAQGLTITEEQAEYLLRASLSHNYAPAVAKAMPGANPAQNDAGLSFHYNTGAIGRASWVKKWLAGQPFYTAIMSWNKAGGKALAGLTRRREREHAMITRGDYGPEGRTPPPVIGKNGRAVPANDLNHALNGTPGMLRQGDSGPEVTDLNAALAVLGYKVSGPSFTFATEQAVRAFQAAHKQLDVDGIAGPATRAAINRERDAKRKLAKTSGSVIASEIASASADVASGGGVPTGVYVVIALIAFCVIGYLAWQYRDELIASVKR